MTDDFKQRHALNCLYARKLLHNGETSESIIRKILKRDKKADRSCAKYALSCAEVSNHIKDRSPF